MTDAPPRATLRGMSRKHHNETETTTVAEGASAVEAADLEPQPEGQTDPAAQAKISTAGAQRSTGDLASELGSLPAIGALDGIRANASAGYYKTVPAEQLVTDLQGVTFEDAEHGKVRDALIERARGGAFSGASK